MEETFGWWVAYSNTFMWFYVRDVMRIDSNVMVYMRRVCNGGALDIYGQYPI